MKRMTYTILAVIVLLVLTGCGLIPQRYKAQAIPAGCDAMCYVPCISKDGDTGIRITGDPFDAGTWDEIGERLSADAREKIEQCDVRRESCVTCLQRLNKAKVITLP